MKESPFKFQGNKAAAKQAQKGSKTADHSGPQGTVPANTRKVNKVNTRSHSHAPVRQGRAASGNKGK